MEIMECNQPKQRECLQEMVVYYGDEKNIQIESERKTGYKSPSKYYYKVVPSYVCWFITYLYQ